MSPDEEIEQKGHLWTDTSLSRSMWRMAPIRIFGENRPGSERFFEVRRGVLSYAFGVFIAALPGAILESCKPKAGGPWTFSLFPRLGLVYKKIMFTGIIQGLGKIVRTRPLAGEVELTVEAVFDWDPELVLGESIAVSGCCLTVSQFKARVFSAHVSGETLSKTTLGRLKTGDRVNLERALRLSDRLGGHLVSGHVDGLGKITQFGVQGPIPRVFL